MGSLRDAYKEETRALRSQIVWFSFGAAFASLVFLAIEFLG
jgi:hypothetical protein